MSNSKYRNADIIQSNAIRNSHIRYMLIPPGTWFQAFLMVIFMQVWFPVILRLFGMREMASNIIRGCAKCSRRKNIMDRAGWIGLPRILLRAEFWSKHRVGWIWSRNQTAPT